ncbi:chorismate synthase [Candidatus Magnetoovum chiemensis]|nr:chorismate synthase [Candidatus Magnetoovum chiemensis]
MDRIKIATSGESHGPALIGIIEGIPSNMQIDSEHINNELKRRQKGYGRGPRMKIESDIAEIISGVRWGKTLGSPIALKIENKDWKNWNKGMSQSDNDKDSIPPITRPRPGHADLSGALKYNFKDIRNVLERSSARETAMRVALGAICKKFLSLFDIFIGSYVVNIGGVECTINYKELYKEHDISSHNEYNKPKIETKLKKFALKADDSPVRCIQENISEQMIVKIDDAKQRGDTIGGIFEVFAIGVPPGLGSYVQWDKKINGKITQAIMSIQAVKAIEIGHGFDFALTYGSKVLDQIYYNSNVLDEYQCGYHRLTNYAGGIEGGMTNGMPILIRAVMKPIPTLRKPLKSVDIISKQEIEAVYERSDVCAVPACSIIAEAMLAFVICNELLLKFSGDCIEETIRNYQSYMNHLKQL